MALTNPNPFGSKAKKLSPKPTPRLFNPNPFGSVATPSPTSLFGGPQKSAGSVPAVAKVAQQRPLTAQQIAQQTVEASLAPILASLGVQRKDLRSEQQSQQQALKDFTAQVMQYIAGIPAQAAGSYNEAAAATTNLAQQAATGLANLNPSAETNSLLQSIGAPQAQVDAIQAQNQNVFGGGGATLFKTAGAIPADVIAQDKAAQLGFYQGLPAVAGLTGTQAMKQLLFTQAKDSRSLAEKLAEVQAKRPSLVQAAASDLQNAQLKRADLDAKAEYRITLLQNQQEKAKTDAQWRSAQQKIDLLRADIAQRKVDADVSYRNSKLAAPQTIAGPGGSKYQYDPTTGAVTQIVAPGAPKPTKVPEYADPASPNYYTDSTGRRLKVGYFWNDKKGRPEKIPTGKSAAAGSTGTAGKPLTPNESIKYKESAAADITKFAYGTVKDPNGKQVVGTLNDPGDDRITYQEAFKRLRTRYAKLGNRAILNLMNEVWTEPGQMVENDDGSLSSEKGGRPFFDSIERTKLKNKGFTSAQIIAAMRPDTRGFKPVPGQPGRYFSDTEVPAVPSRLVTRMLTVLGRSA